ncbi:hypothetical protein BGW36DRAFT_320562 [Talaromyces proteolyticus]|uniref:C2H2-type domain-containing protein n=1 Tax=Talaromyces proteolyticus TaxID=1131652 RepID=A0AAD4PWL1_9EURO|nr:uncharacterized protein BGW36DRAFT_320562 [Talaromyces proteolyticus]KAH8697995.1 hypothetical protein BGW36DRAFT_320562 [Talaromyces proteolyticus]
MSPQLPLSPPTKSQHKCSQPSIFSLLKDTDSIQITKQAYHNSTKQSYSASISNAPSIQKSQSQVTLPAIAASLLIPPSERGSVSQELRMSPPTPINRYVCRTCRKAFSRPSGLRIHSYSHTGEKPFRCTHVGCGKAFNVRSNMKRHERGFHSGRPLAVIV